MGQDHAATESNFLYDHPGIVATLFAIVVSAIFISSLYVSATSHHEGGEGEASGEHATPAASGGAASPMGSPTAAPTGAH